MDDSVVRAMEIWPDVPECYGWLRLDRRGNWLLTGGGGSAAIGQRISNVKVCDFIGRNYLRSEKGSYFFQNGPQRVHVELAYTPYIVSVLNPEDNEPTLITQSGVRVDAVSQVWIDDQGALILEIVTAIAGESEALTNKSIALLDDRDMEQLLSQFAGSGGAALTDNKLLLAIELAMAGEPSGLQFQWRGSCCAVQSVDSDHIEKLGFIQELRPLAD